MSVLPEEPGSTPAPGTRALQHFTLLERLIIKDLGPEDRQGRAQREEGTEQGWALWGQGSAAPGCRVWGSGLVVAGGGG
jgi:hypothetical protein